MGIHGLLGFLNEYVDDIDLNILSNKVVGVDAFIWLYCGHFCCPYQLAMNIPCDENISYLVNQVNNLLQIVAKPVLVFDGCVPYMKKTEDDACIALRQSK